MYYSEFKIILGLAAPLMIGQLAQTGIGVADTMIAGAYSTEDLAAVALGTAIWLPLSLFFSGILLAITPFVAQRLGANDQTTAVKSLIHATWLAIFLSLLGVVLLINVDHFLSGLSLEPHIHQVTLDYLEALSYGLLPVLLFQVIRFFHEGHGLTRVTMVMAVIAFLINIPLNFVFVFGYGDIPAMGGAGCGVATTLVYVIMAVMGWGYYFFRSEYQSSRHHFKWSIPSIAIIRNLLSIGIPIAAALLFEVALFISIAFLIVPLGTNVIAAHQIAISYTSFVFMIPLSLAMALTIRVGHLAGSKDYDGLWLVVKVGYIMAIGLGVLVTMITALFASVFVGWFTNDLAVTQIALSIFLLAAVYQLSDAVQVMSAGILRGLHDTKATMLITFVVYWLVALPVGYYLCYGGFDSQQEPWFGIEGFWISFVVGLSLAAIGLTLRLLQLKRQFIS